MIICLYDYKAYFFSKKSLVISLKNIYIYGLLKTVKLTVNK